MRWKDRRQSTNVEDRRGISPKAAVGGGIGTVVIAFLVSGTLGAASTMRLIVKSDLNDTSLDD